MMVKFETSEVCGTKFPGSQSSDDQIWTLAAMERSLGGASEENEDDALLSKDR